MKKFTLIIGMFLIALCGYADMSIDLQKKVLKVKIKTDGFLQQNNRFSDFSKSAYNSASYLKSAEAEKLDSVVSWVYDRENLVWKYDWRDVYQYNSQMKSSVWLEDEWDETAKIWKTWNKSEIVYGTNGNISSLLMYNYDDETGEFVASKKMVVFINQDGKLDSTLNYIAESGDLWTIVAKQNYQYDSSGRLILSEMWTMEEEENGDPTGILIKSMIIKYIYNVSGLITKVGNYYFIEEEELLFSQTEYTYNSSIQLITSVNSGLNFITFEYEYSNKTDHTYNSAGDISMDIFSVWSIANETWIEQYKYENIYGEKEFSEVVYPSYVNFIFGVGDPEFMIPYKIIVNDKSFQMINENWVQTDKSTFYYSVGTSVNLNDLNNHSVSVYPNPATESIMLNWNNNHKYLNLQIFQITGAKVMDQNAFSGERVSVSHLVNGIYLVKLMKGSQLLYTGKLIKS